MRTRPFQPGADDDRWLEVNNLSFAHHTDQAEQTQEDLHSLMGQPWFDADGFLLLDADRAGARAGRLDGFCWTKVHAGHDPPLGEIFVIGVDPSAAGRGLGRALTIAGLDHLHSRDVHVAVLYVDVDNAGAMTMYERLGFREHHLDRLYGGRACGAEPIGAPTRQARRPLRRSRTAFARDGWAYPLSQ
ncbi:MAG: GNAT family N-acetyltransferase [Acidimicrobiales bacterium]